MKNKILLILLTLCFAFGLSSCKKADPDFFKSMFKGTQNKQANMDVTIQVSRIMVELAKYKYAIEQCIKDGKTLTLDAVARDKPVDLPKESCFLQLKDSEFRDQDIIFDFDDVEKPMLTAVIGGTANDKILGHTMTMSRTKKNDWRCRTTIQLAFIPVGCEHQY